MTVNRGLRLNGEDIKRSSDFCYLGSIVAENGGTSREVNARIQKTRGSFSKNMVAKYYFQQRSMESNRTRIYTFRNTKKKI